MSKARWGVGAIELNRQKDALPGEIMVDSELGMFAVKSYTGSENSSNKVLSYEYIAKMKTIFSEFKNMLAATGRTGKIVRIDLGDYIGPFVAENGNSYAADSIAISSKQLEFFQFNINVDIVNNKTGLIEFDIEPTVKMTIGLAHNDETEQDKVISITNLVTDLNSRVFEPDYTGFLTENVEHEFRIKTVSFSLPNGYAADNYKIIAHSMFVAFQEV